MNIEQATLTSTDLARQPLVQQLAHTRLSKDISGWYLLFFQAADLGLTVAALWLAMDLRRLLPFGPALGDEGWVNPHVYLVALALGFIVYASAGVYHADRLRSIRDELRAVLKATLIGIVLLAGLLYFLDRGVSRWLFIYYGLAQISLVVTTRLLARGACRALGLSLTRPRRTVIVGAGPVGQEVARRLAHAKTLHYQVIGYLDDKTDGSADSDGLPILGPLDRAGSIIRGLHVDDLLIALPLYAWDAAARLMEAIHDLPIQVRVIPDYFDLAYLYTRPDELAGMPVISLKEPVLAPRQRAIKRAFDLVVGGLLLLCLSPLLIIAGFAIKLDSAGPVLYRQKRIGEGGRVFLMVKLRTMVADADRHEPHLIESNGDSLQFNKRPDDPA